MNTPIMCDYLAFMDRHCASRGIKGLLLMDNFSPHTGGEEWLRENEGGLQHLEIDFFPANSTSKFQPMDQGIIRSFKAGYHRLFLGHCIESWSIGEDPISGINIRHAIQWVVEAWNKVTNQTILNCWRHSTCIERPAELAKEGPDPSEVDLVTELNTLQAEGREVLPIEDLLNPQDEIVGNIVGGNPKDLVL